MGDGNFQDPASVYAYSLMYVHHQVMGYMIIILSVVYGSFYRILKQYNGYSHNKQMGTLYTLFYSNGIFIKLETGIMSILFLITSKLLNSSLEIMKFLTKSFPSLNNDLVGLLSVGYMIDNKMTIENSKRIVENLIIQKYQYYNYQAIANNAYALGGDKEFLQVQNFRDNILLEYIGAIFPSLVIFLILIPSLYLLYSLEENMNPKFNIKVIGHQWFGSYEFDSYDLSFEFDSNLVIESDLTEGAKRLLEVDNRLYLPVNVPLRILITSSDVLHSGAVPELGIKVDAVPGRLNDAITLIRRPGVFYGQCSELCGVGHGFMPIVVEACSYKQGLQHISE